MNKKFCLSCGEINPDEAYFCLRCGERFRFSPVTGMPLVSVHYEPTKLQYRSKSYRPSERRLIWRLLAAISVVLIFLSVVTFLPSSTNTPTSVQAYTFETGKTPPKAVRELIQNGTAVLLFNQYGCSSCTNMNAQFAKIQTQYKNTDVAFATYYIISRNDTTTPSNVARAYQVNSTPTAVVVRSDGAFARIAYHSETDFNAIKGAIEKSLQQKASMANQCRTCKVTYNAS